MKSSLDQSLVGISRAGFSTLSANGPMVYHRIRQVPEFLWIVAALLDLRQRTFTSYLAHSLTFPSVSCFKCGEVCVNSNTQGVGNLRPGTRDGWCPLGLMGQTARKPRVQGARVNGRTNWNSIPILLPKENSTRSSYKGNAEMKEKETDSRGYHLDRL